ncbi:lipid A biosynthesis lauroyl acyltransferase [Neisseriaceae bacterium ESL0693]|nr:lipid A biosynthesis lauroyl acyltransferase [Neisseriaceae bacterium ESL0693]
MKLAFFFLYLLHWLPLSVIHAMARVVGWLSYYVVAPRRRIGLINLRHCFPEWSERRRRAVLKQHFYHMAMLLLEYGLYWYGSARRLKKMVRYQDKHYLDAALAAGDKVILLYPHFTAFEAAVYALNQDDPLISVYAHQKNKLLDQQIRKGRHRYNNVFLIGRTEGLRAIIKKIKTSAAPFLYLPDQDFGRRESIFVDFFGIPTATIGGLSRIAALTQAKVIPAIPTRDKDGRVTLRFYPPWEHFPSKDVYADTQRMNDFIEARIREQPEQYYWLHKRFKTRPEGVPSFYQRS